jgi:hypothetical protein
MITSIVNDNIKFCSKLDCTSEVIMGPGYYDDYDLYFRHDIVNSYNIEKNWPPLKGKPKHIVTCFEETEFGLMMRYFITFHHPLNKI